jgi:predicted enzyme related to lactoylglutathione lyase
MYQYHAFHDSNHLQQGRWEMGVTGIGAFMFRANDPEMLAAWYAEHLGVGGSPYGQWETQAGPSVFSPSPADTDYFPADHAWMLNLRVSDLDALLATLRASGIEVTTNPDWDMPGVGRFARIHDPEGNPIELWEPDDEE